MELSLVDVSIIFVSYNTAEMTRKAINLVKQSLHQLNIEIFVIDNASKDNSVEMIQQEFSELNLITNKVNVGFGRANNQALPFYKGRYVLLLNTDAFVEPDTIQKTYDFMQENPKTGILGVKLIGRDGALQPSCRYFPTFWSTFLFRTGLNKLLTSVKMVDDMSWDHNAVRNCDWVPGCYYLIRKEVIDQVGLFDPRYFLYSEEMDHCLAAKRAGWEVTYYPYTSVVHIGGESAKTDNKISSVSRQVSVLQVESELLYFRKNHGFFVVVLHSILTIIAELILMLKRIVKAPFKLNQYIDFKALNTFCKVAFQTRLGARSIH